MPAILASVGRSVIIMLIQVGAIAAVEKAFDWVITKIRAHHAEVNGLDPEDADNQTANDILDIAIMAGVTLFSLRSKLPVRIAERLGFTTKGFVKRKISAAGAKKLAAKGVTAVTANATKTEVAQEIAVTVAKQRGSVLSTVAKIANVTVAVIGVPVGVGLLVVNTIDFAAWPSSSYQDTFQKFFSFFGINPDATAKNSKVLSEDMWKRIYGVYVNLGVIGINDPYKEMSVPFTRENLIDLVDKVAANMIAEKGEARLGWIIGATQGFMAMKAPVTSDTINKAFSGTSGTTAVSSGVSDGVVTTKVFTGIISQGVVGQGLVFTPRQDDLIESSTELKQAAANNLAPFLAALTSKIVYEVKVVSSIVTADGFKQTGKTQQVQNGWDALGKPKYKTVTNKFGILNIYVFTDKKVRTKISTIVLGPIDSVKMRIGTNDLTALSMSLPSLVTTTNINDIKGIETAAPITITTPPVAVTQPVVTQTNQETLLQNYWNKLGITDERWNSSEFDSASKAAIKETYDIRIRQNLPFPEALKSTVSVSATVTAVSKDGTYQIEKSDVPGGKEVIFYPKGMTPNTSLRLGPTTLFEWYQTQGQALPSVSERSVIYEGLGLGSKSYYTGTSEQNTKLLSALKAQ